MQRHFGYCLRSHNAPLSWRLYSTVLGTPKLYSLRLDLISQIGGLRVSASYFLGGGQGAQKVSLTPVTLACTFFQAKTSQGPEISGRNLGLPFTA